MPVSKRSAELMTRSSWIRKMFEEGRRMRSDGKGPICDFSLGSPTLEPPVELQERLKYFASGVETGIHRYMPNPGHDSTRKAVAGFVSDETGVKIGAENIIMTTGAGGGLNVVMKALLDPGDEIILLRPFFGEYPFYVDNHGGMAVEVETGAAFQIDHSAIEKALTPRTRGILVNSPNNPSGVVYNRESVEIDKGHPGQFPKQPLRGCL